DQTARARAVARHEVADVAEALMLGVAMRHLKAGRRLGRNAAHRNAMFRNLAMALFRHERIVTTVAKAKEVRPFIERLITLAKRGTLHARRQGLARLGPPSQAAVRPIEGK